MSSRIWRRLLVLLAIVIAIVVLRLTVFQPDPIAVTIRKVDRGRVERTVVNSRAGAVESRQRSRMSPGLSGLVAQIPVKKGQVVQAGEVLLRIDDAEQQAQVRLAERSLEAARAGIDDACSRAVQARRELDRAEALAASNLVSDQELEEARLSVQVANAGCTAAQEGAKQAEASLALARTTLSKSVLRAPFAGVVLDVTTEVGEWITPSPPGVSIPPVIDLIDPDDLYVRAPIDEADVGEIRSGLTVRIALDAFRGQTFDGTITYVAPFVETREEQSRTLTVEAEFAEATLPLALLPGLSADLEILLDAREDVLRIPTFALLEGDAVLVVRGDRLERVSVQTGLRNWEYVEVTSGVELDDPVVVSLDRPEIKAGARVSASEAKENP